MTTNVPCTSMSEYQKGYNRTKKNSGCCLWLEDGDGGGKRERERETKRQTERHRERERDYTIGGRGRCPGPRLLQFKTLSYFMLDKSQSK